MKKIAIAFGIIACLAVLSMLLTSASAQEEDNDYWMTCPGGWGDLREGVSSYLDPATIYYMKDVVGNGSEDCRTTVATHTKNAGLESSMSSRGSAMTLRDYLTFDIDTHPEDPQLDITSELDKSYRTFTFDAGLVESSNRTLTGEICVKSYMVGTMVSEKYMDTYDISGDFDHTGNGTVSSTEIINRKIYGTSRFAVTVNDIENHHLNIMRVREEHMGKFEMDREVTVTRYGGP